MRHSRIPIRDPASSGLKERLTVTPIQLNPASISRMQIGPLTKSVSTRNIVEVSLEVEGGKGVQGKLIVPFDDDGFAVKLTFEVGFCRKDTFF